MSTILLLPPPSIQQTRTNSQPFTLPFTARALELFMISLIQDSASEAKDASSKKVSTLHLKQAVLKNDKFDFLADIVGKVPDAPGSGGGGGGGGGSSAKADDSDDEKKKRKPGRGKRKDSE